METLILFGIGYALVSLIFHIVLYVKATPLSRFIIDPTPMVAYTLVIFLLIILYAVAFI